MGGLRMPKSRRVEQLRKGVVRGAPEICVERVLLMTESYRKNGQLPIIIKRAKGLGDILKGMSIYIQPEELIVGNQASKPRAAPIFPEFSVNWIKNELDKFGNRPLERFLIHNGSKQKLKAVCEYWEGKTHFDRVNSMISMMLRPQQLKAWDPRSANFNQVISDVARLTTGDGHIIPNYEKILKVGLGGIKEEALAELKNLDLTQPESLEKELFLRSVVMSVDAASEFIGRFAVEGKKLAGRETSPRRKSELQKIAEVCHWISINPAKTFWQALQLCWFVNLMIQIESNGHSISYGRFDQYLYPYYKKDIDKGKVTQDEALELVECFLMKCNELIKLREWNASQYLGGYPMFDALTLGGVTPDGEDSTNDLSYICLEAMAELRLPRPTVVVRIHNKTPQEFLFRSCESLIRHGGGLPAFFNDEVIIPLLLSEAVCLEDARNWALVGCAEPVVPGKSNSITGGGCFVNLPKVLELTLNDGLNPSTGLKIFPGNGKLSDFTSFDELIKTFENQLSSYIKLVVLFDNITALTYSELTPTPFTSSLIEYRIKIGKDISRGKGLNYNRTIVQGHGLPDVANALAALKKLVFEEKLVDSFELERLLRTNFKGGGGELIRQTLIHKAPKYGNDDDYVDLLAKEVGRYFCNEVRKYTPLKGGMYGPTFQTLTANVPQGQVVRATPDGRKAGEALADNASPAAGTDLKGPTATIKSVAKLDHILVSNGAILNLKLHPTTVGGKEGLKKFSVLIKTFFELGGFQVQFNIVSAETLREAQKTPSKYPNLIVKVAGYSALFATLDKKLQDQIIERTEHAL